MRRSFALAFVVLLLSSPGQAQTLQPWSVRFARSVIAHNPEVAPRWDYTAGVVLLAINRVATKRNDAAMLDYVKRNIDRFVQPDGTIVGYKTDDFNLDQIAEGRLLFPLFATTKDARYRIAAQHLRDQLSKQPRTPEGGFWHKGVYPQQMWLDGLYMAEPFYAEFARTFSDPSAFDDVAKQFLLVERHTHDPRTGLMYHGWDAARAQKWADPKTGLSKSFWGRAMGWYMLGAVDALDYVPRNHRDRTALIKTIKQAAEAAAKVQDPQSGLWWQVLDQPHRKGNYLEASASSMFVYALAKAARLGYIDDKYRAVATRGFDGLLKNLVKTNSDGTVSLTNICQVAGLGGALRKDGSYRDGTFEYYVSEPVVADDYKGVGPFIMAADELGR
ncbi:MAG TPA: glycoside hydrolase family 88 protein [Gemmatimonadaceae bacterium]|nr:glycoside hydrolase family 88 protein [Gemmatimonadaceae bacterium]